mmetsp:Transcript_5650/g.11710  ORF Transcript_5650/g.11710 Transcript_5650/m.11710 type:complete len:1333 (-) Transcript_5650:55-4053(-)|eukprot:CAMPEP_0168740168 /NCGR_PEP_ID=MMETSP0724-20121128/11837_1 /TAXON_ID=265536 /ORGANISM="Amphiprora sp., Strain CCMP467" /LENGTH=1332 /DNA_ID=CAMNT_0008787589 /DNA_START=190 /DNA_END=4188 /DNA_ORIENTATION=-
MSGHDKTTNKLTNTDNPSHRLVEYFVIVSSVEKDARPDNRNDAAGATDDAEQGFGDWKTESYDEEDEKHIFREHKFRPQITARYPLHDHADNPLHSNVTFFCHPSGGIHLRTEEHLPKVHFFVATGGTGKQIYGTCLTLWEPVTLKVKVAKEAAEDKTDSSQTNPFEDDGDNDDDKATDTNNPFGDEPEMQEEERTVYLPKCLVILSMYPYLAAFREFLTQLHHLTKGDGDAMKLPLERYIVNFCSEIPAPPPGSFEVQTTILDSVIKIWSPPNNLPITWVSIPFAYTFECLDIDNIITVWHCLALERQVLITSTQLSILTQATEMFLSLLFPMRWSHAYIPVLPTFLIPMLSAPMPFLCGINKANLADALYDLSPECVLVDLDKNTVTLGPETLPLPPLPPNQEATLRGMLDQNVGMVFREVRSLTKNDDFSEQGSNLPGHVKMMAEAMWESRLCLFDEAFHLMYTPEEARKNLLNGNDASGIESKDVQKDTSNPLSMVININKDEVNSRKQSPWDAVQEAFLDTFVYLLRNYRKYLVFPSKHNEGSYGGAGFRSKEFVESQRYDMRGFLEQMIGTQMFDNFITKRLYGSGEADVAFFDGAVDKFLKTAGMFADVDLSGRIFSSTTSTTSRTSMANNPAASRRSNSRSSMKAILSKAEDPLLQSAKVHRSLKTIVPPEPTGEGLPQDLSGFAGLVLRDGKDGDEDDDTQSVTSANTRNSQVSAPSRLTVPEKTVRFVYKEFPSTLNKDIFGAPRPLPAAVIAEFDRQRKDAAQFKRKGQRVSEKNKPAAAHIRRAHTNMDPETPPSPEAATFTVFFMAFTALVGKELVQMAHDAESQEKTILSTYVPTGQYGPSDSESAATGDDGEEEEGEEPVDLEEKADIAEMKADRPNMGGMFGDDEDMDSNHETLVRQGVANDQESLDAVDLQSITSNDEMAFGKGEAKVQTNENSTAASTEAPLPSLANGDDETVNTNKTGASNKTEDSKPKKRFRDKLSDLQIEEAKATGRAQLGLAFEMLTMMKKRGLQADPEAYQSLIDACGRVGDTKRATELLAMMHEDGIVADGTVYACLVSAFSAESAWKDKTKEEELPEWANSTAVEMDWNKLQKRTFLERLVGQVAADPEEGEEDADLSTYQKLSNRLFRSNKKEGGANGKAAEDKMEFFCTEQVERQISLGENLVEIVFPDILVDTENETCPRCNYYLSDDDVVEGWTPGDNNNYTTTCPNCTQRFVPHFCVQSSSPTFMGSKGAASPLLCERLSPWVLQKEIRTVMSDVQGIDALLDPSWREKEYKNSVLWWNLVLSCMRYRLPFSFLLQGSFEQNLIAPMLEDES